MKYEIFAKITSLKSIISKLLKRDPVKQKNKVIKHLEDTIDLLVKFSAAIGEEKEKEAKSLAKKIHSLNKENESLNNSLEEQVSNLSNP